MAELTAAVIRERLSDYLLGDLDPAAFHDWLAVVLRDAHKSPDQSVEQLAHEIEWAFYDLERGSPAEAVRNVLAQLAVSSGRPLILGEQPYIFSAAVTSSKLQEWAGIVLLGQLQILRETVSA